MLIKITNPEEWYKVDRECIDKKHILSGDRWLLMRKRILERDKYKCVYCGDTNGPFEIDHVMPKSRGGLDTENNLVCACQSCNRAKKDRTPEEWGIKIRKQN